MKKFIKLISAVGAIALAANTVKAQNGFEFFGSVRPVQLIALTNQASTSALTGPTIDLQGYVGICGVTIMEQTNVGGANAVTNTFQVSWDTTNWMTMSNYAVATLTSVIHTNTYYVGGVTNNTPLYVTNQVQIAGTVTYPSASATGSATPFVVPANFTNSGPFNLGGNAYQFIGWNVGDQPRYLRLVLQATVTNGYSECATLIGRGPAFP